MTEEIAATGLYTVREYVEESVPFVVSLAVAVIVVVPAATGVITPDASTVATPVLEDVYVTPLFVAFAGLTVASTESPVLVVRTGVEPVNSIAEMLVAAIPVTVTVAVDEKDADSADAAVIVAVPGDTPVTTPVDVFTVATAVSLEDHVIL